MWKPLDVTTKYTMGEEAIVDGPYSSLMTINMMFI